jgi:hypothetical protein
VQHRNVRHLFFLVQIFVDFIKESSYHEPQTEYAAGDKPEIFDILHGSALLEVRPE